MYLRVADHFYRASATVVAVALAAVVAVAAEAVALVATGDVVEVAAVVATVVDVAVVAPAPAASSPLRAGRRRSDLVPSYLFCFSSMLSMPVLCLCMLLSHVHSM